MTQKNRKMKFEEEGKKANFRIFMRELSAISGLEEDEVFDILYYLSTYLKEYRKDKHDTKG